jgi:hypothetical protein
VQEENGGPRDRLIKRPSPHLLAPLKGDRLTGGKDRTKPSAQPSQPVRKEACTLAVIPLASSKGPVRSGKTALYRIIDYARVRSDNIFILSRPTAVVAAEETVTRGRNPSPKFPALSDQCVPAVTKSKSHMEHCLDLACVDASVYFKYPVKVMYVRAGKEWPRCFQR